MLSRRQIEKFGSLCDEDLAYLERQVDTMLAIRRAYDTLPAVPLRLVTNVIHENISTSCLIRETIALLKPQPAKVEASMRVERRLQQRRRR